MQPVIRLATKAVLWVLLLLIVGLVGALIIVPKIMGWVPLAVLSGSMEPTVNPGDEVVVQRVSGGDVQHIGVGTVITFLPYPDDPTLVTHRVVAVRHGSDGSVQFTTKGDANPTPDPHPVQGKQVRGVLLYHVPWVGRLTTAIPGGNKGLAITLLAVALLAYGAWQVGAGLRERARRRSGSPPATPPLTRGRHRAVPTR